MSLHGSMKSEVTKYLFTPNIYLILDQYVEMLKSNYKKKYLIEKENKTLHINP
jgi:hypothetical protein